MAKLDLVILGHIFNETIKFPDRTIGPVLGGPVSYFSVAAVRLDARVGIVAKIGKEMPMELLRPLYQAGVDTKGLVVEPTGTKNILVYHADSHKTIQLLAKSSPICLQDIPKEYRQAGIIYAGEALWDLSLEIMEALHRSETKLAADLQPLFEHRSEGYDNFLRELLPCLDIVKVSWEDCPILFAERTLTPEEYSRLLVEWGAKIGIITLAEKGSVVATMDNVFHIPPFTRRAINITGAGDVYGAGFLVYYQRYGDAKGAGLFASATASLVCERTGGVVVERMPTVSEVMQRMRERTS